jgi:hypothetical protein
VRSCRAATSDLEWYLTALYRSSMSNEMPETFARRMRLSSIAIFTAIAVTLAALIAITIASHETSPAAMKITGPVTRLPAANSGLLPVIDR